MGKVCCGAIGIGKSMEYLIETFDYDPTKHRLVINGEGANWITARLSRALE